MHLLSYVVSIFQIVVSKNSRSRPTLSKEEMIAQQARHDEYGQGSGGEDSLVYVTMEMAISAWSAVDCRCGVVLNGICLFSLKYSFLCSNFTIPCVIPIFY
jgi:hypothetical protein